MFDWIFFILANKEDMHKSLDEFEIPPDSTTDSCLIGSSSFLQVTRTSIKFRMSLKFSKIQPSTAELAALGSLEKST